MQMRQRPQLLLLNQKSPRRAKRCRPGIAEAGVGAGAAGLGPDMAGPGGHGAGVDLIIGGQVLTIPTIPAILTLVGDRLPFARRLADRMVARAPAINAKTPAEGRGSEFEPAKQDRLSDWGASSYETAESSLKPSSSALKRSLTSI
jgi:hypothetical protein